MLVTHLWTTKWNMVPRVRHHQPVAHCPLSVNPTSWSFPPYSLMLIKLRKSHLGNSSKLKQVFFLVARQRLSKLIFTLTPASVDCARFGVGCPLSVVHCLLSVVPCPSTIFCQWYLVIKKKSVTLHLVSACGEIGRRARLRIWYREMCRFESYQAHEV